MLLLNPPLFMWFSYRPFKLACPYTLFIYTHKMDELVKGRGMAMGQLPAFWQDIKLLWSELWLRWVAMMKDYTYKEEQTRGNGGGTEFLFSIFWEQVFADAGTHWWINLSQFCMGALDSEGIEAIYYINALRGIEVRKWAGKISLSSCDGFCTLKQVWKPLQYNNKN